MADKATLKLRELMSVNINELHDNWSRFSDNLYRYLTLIRLDSRRRMAVAMAKKKYQYQNSTVVDILTILSRQKMRVNELANTLRISKQQCVQSLKPIEARGLVKRVRDPSDSRAKLVLLTKKGNRLVDDGIHEVTVINEHYEAKIGKRKAKKLSFYLKEAYRIFDVHYGAMWLDEAHVVTPSLIIPYVDFLSRDLDQRLSQYVASYGYTGLKPSLTQVLAQISLSGTKLAHLEELNQVTNAAIGRITSELESLGYVKRSIDKKDARARFVEFTKEGLRLIADTVKSVDMLNSELDRGLTKGSIEEFESLSRELCVKLDLNLETGSKSNANNPLSIIDDKAKDPHLSSRINMSQLLLYFATLIEKSERTLGPGLSKFVVKKESLIDDNNHPGQFSDSAIRKLQYCLMQEQIVENSLRALIGDEEIKQFFKLMNELSKHVDCQ